MSYPMSIHMVQHLMLGLIIPALFVFAAASKLKILWLPLPTTVSWLLGVGTMLAWHLPGHRFHLIQPWIFLITGTIFWWPILGPPARRISPLAAVCYLFSACLSCTVMGAYLTFTAAGNPDQQLAGLLMWVPGCFIYLSAILVTVKRWYSETAA